MAAQPGLAVTQSLQHTEPQVRPPLPLNNDWSLEEDIVFESALAELWSTPDMLKKVKERLPMHTFEQVQHRLKILEEDVANIDAGRIPLPNYASAQEHTAMERRKGIPWTEEEHRLFLMGLAKFGKGDWRSISRNFVISRTPTQVASHAQKYFIRLNSLNKKDKRRSSIHDITSPGANAAEVTGMLPRPVHMSQPPIAPHTGHSIPGHLAGGVMQMPRPVGSMSQPGPVINGQPRPVMNGQPRPAMVQPRPPQ